MRIDLPGGQWAELKDPGDLTGADQDDYFDAYDALIAAQPQPEPRPDPANPAVMLDPPRPRLTNASARALRDKLLEMAITAWSYDHIPLPYTAAGAKRQLPVRACNALYEAARPLDDALSGTEEDGDGPKQEAPTGTGGSSDTSADGTESPLQESPAGQSVTP
jgi:hypothetical protein